MNAKYAMASMVFCAGFILTITGFVMFYQLNSPQAWKALAVLLTGETIRGALNWWMQRDEKKEQLSNMRQLEAFMPTHTFTCVYGHPHSTSKGRTACEARNGRP